MTGPKAAGDAAPPQTSASRIAAGYDTDQPTVVLGSVVLDGAADPLALVRMPLAMFNRHGLVAGATGTGKTKTLQVIAEQLSAAGVPVLIPDVKSDLTGLFAPGETNDKIVDRAADTGDSWAPASFPVEFLSLAGQGAAVPIRATVDSFGPILLSKVLGLNETQESTLGLIVHWADERNLPLLDLKDLRAVIMHLTSDEGKADLKELGGVSKATAGVILRAVTNLDAQGGDQFFGEPEFEMGDLLRQAPDGRGVITLLEVAELQTQPVLFSTFLMWLLAELFEELPEVGDLDRPKLVFLFDEAHLLFADASKAFLQAVQQTVKLIRSKGVGVFFCTQLPTDVPGPVLSQLGARIQHALRAFTPDDQKSPRRNRQDLPDHRGLRPVRGVDEPRHRRGDRDRAVREGRADTGGLDPDPCTALPDGAGPDGNDHVSHLRVAAACEVRSGAGPGVGVRDAQGQGGGGRRRAARIDSDDADRRAGDLVHRPRSLARSGHCIHSGSGWLAIAGAGKRRQLHRCRCPPRRHGRRRKPAGGLGGVLDSPMVTSFLRSLGTAVGGSLGRSIFGTRKRRRR